MGMRGVEWALEGTDAPLLAQARADELRDVLLNVSMRAWLARGMFVSAHHGMTEA